MGTVSLDPLRIAAIPGATLEVVVDDDDDSESSFTTSMRFSSSRATAQKSKSKSARPPTQQSRGPTRSVVSQTSTLQSPPIQTARSAAPQALPLERTSPTTSFKPTSTATTTTSTQGSFLTSLFSKATPEAPTGSLQRAPLGTSTVAQESSAIEPLAVSTNSLETLNSNNDQNNAALRNPQYGLVEEALENYNHIEVPPETLEALQPKNHNNDARNPQCESVIPIDAQLTNSMNQARAPQDHSTVTASEGYDETVAKARQGDAKAQVAVGDMYLSGERVRYNRVTAHYWFLQAAEQGHAVAQYKVGVMYRRKEVVCPDNAMIEVLFRKAADQGVMEAQYEMGKLYQEGSGLVEQDPDEAMTWYLKAVEQGYPPASVAIGSLHESGQGGRIPEKNRNYSGAMDWYLKAASQGDVQAHYELGRMFDDGVGVVQDDLKAKQWYTQAAGRGHYSAKKRLLALEAGPQPPVEPAPGTLRGLISRFSQAFF